jgi:hypothetical protein
MTTSPDDSGDRDDSRAIDAAFDEIVANIDAPGTAASSAPWPAAEGETGERPAPPDPPPAPQRTPRADWSEWDDIRMPSPPPPDELIDNDEDHYVPPPPPPLPTGDRIGRWAWAGAVGAPVLAILLALIGWGLTGLTGLVLVIAFLAGFGTLISRLRPGPRIDDGPDDGAVV